MLDQLCSQVSFPKRWRIPRAIQAPFETAATPKPPNLRREFHKQFANCCGMQVRLARIDDQKLLAQLAGFSICGRL